MCACGWKALVVAPGAPDGDAGIADLVEFVADVAEPRQQALPGCASEKSDHGRRVAVGIYIVNSEFGKWRSRLRGGESLT